MTGVIRAGSWPGDNAYGSLVVRQAGHNLDRVQFRGAALTGEVKVQHAVIFRNYVAEDTFIGNVGSHGIGLNVKLSMAANCGRSALMIPRPGGEPDGLRFHICSCVDGRY